MAVAIVGATAGALVKKVVSAYLRDKSSQSVVVKRIEKKMGVKFFDEPLKESNLEDIRKIIQQELAAFSNAKPAEVDEKIMESFLVLISGQEKLLEKVLVIPLAWTNQKIQAEFGKSPHRGVHPDEAIALGAAILADSLDRIDSIVLVDVLPASIGVGLPDGTFLPILKKGMSLPTSQTAKIQLKTKLKQFI